MELNKVFFKNSIDKNTKKTVTLHFYFRIRTEHIFKILHSDFINLKFVSSRSGIRLTHWLILQFMYFNVRFQLEYTNSHFSHKPISRLFNYNIFMETTRQQKISRMLQKELGEIFLLYARQLHGTLITVTGVKVSPDLGVAHTHLSIFPSNKSSEIIKKVTEDTKSIRFDLGKRVRYQLRIVPELFFHIDDSLDYIENIDNLLKSDPPSPLTEEPHHSQED